MARLVGASRSAMIGALLEVENPDAYPAGAEIET